MTKKTTLAKRGYALATGPSIRDLFGAVLANPYDPVENPGGFVNIGTAENYAMIPEVQDYIKQNLDLASLDFTYKEGPWGTARLRKAMAKHMQKTFPSIEEINPADMLITNGVTSLMNMLAHTVFDAGDGMLLPSPSYQAFASDIGLNANAKCVFVKFGTDDGFAATSTHHWEEALLTAEESGTKIRAVMLCNPHNPLGRCYPKESIVSLMKFCNKYNLHLFSDEIYAASVYDVPGDDDAVPFTSVLSFDYTPYISSDYVHVIYGMSKDFASGGMRIGCFYTKNKELMRAMSAITAFHWSGNAAESIATTILEDEAFLSKYKEDAKKKLSELNVLARELLGELGVGYIKGANAGFFLMLDLSPFLPSAEDIKEFEKEAKAKGEEIKWQSQEVKWQKEELLMKRLMSNAVFLTNGSAMGSEEPGFFRLIFSQDVRALRTGLSRVGKTIGRSLKEERELPLR